MSFKGLILLDNQKYCKNCQEIQENCLNCNELGECLKCTEDYFIT